MNKKMILIAFLGACLFFNSSAYADPMGDYHSMGGHGHGMMHRSESQCPIAGKVMMKAHFLLEHKADLALTEDQVKTIKDLDLQVEKDSLRQNADRKIFMLDLKSKLEEDKIDVEGTESMIDKGFSALAAGTKTNLGAYAKLKSTLTPDQLAKVKELLKSQRQAWKNNKDQ